VSIASYLFQTHFYDARTFAYICVYNKYIHMYIETERCVCALESILKKKSEE